MRRGGWGVGGVREGEESEGKVEVREVDMSSVAIKSAASDSLLRYLFSLSRKHRLLDAKNLLFYIVFSFLLSINVSIFSIAVISSRAVQLSA